MSFAGVEVPPHERSCVTYSKRVNQSEKAVYSCFSTSTLVEACASGLGHGDSMKVVWKSSSGGEAVEIIVGEVRAKE